jgi:hypothetical protein
MEQNLEFRVKLTNVLLSDLWHEDTTVLWRENGFGSSEYPYKKKNQHWVDVQNGNCEHNGPTLQQNNYLTAGNYLSKHLMSGNCPKIP